MPTFTGTSGADQIAGTEDDDVITGLGGDDYINGRGGNDVIDAGSDNDTVFGGDGDDTIIVYQYNPFPSGLSMPRPTNGFGRTAADGGSGYDTLEVRPGTYGGDYTYRALASAPEAIQVGLAWYPQIIVADATSIERIVGAGQFDLTLRTAAIEIQATGASTLIGGRNADRLVGSAGADTIHVGPADVALGGDGDDDFIVTLDQVFPASTRADGGAGVDRLIIEAQGYASSLSVDLRVAAQLVANVGINGFEAVDIRQAGGDVTLIGSAGANNRLSATAASGSQGRIAITGGDGGDILSASGGGSSLILAGAGDDTLHSFTVENIPISGAPGFFAYRGLGRVEGGDGNDTFSGLGVFFGGAGDDVFQAFSGGNRYENTSYGEVDGGEGSDTFVLTLSGALGQSGWNFSLVTGLATNLSGLRPASTQYTLSSVENIVGSIGDDVLTGDAVANRIEGGLGADTIRGGGGNDLIYGDVAVGDDRGGNDRLYGEDGNDRIYAGAGDDLLDGGSGDDLLNGGAGADTLDGGSGNDLLYGGAGNDALNGGDGVDTAVFGYAYGLADITYDGASIIVTGPEGRDVLTGVEFLAFSDALLTIGADGRVQARPATVNGTAAADIMTGTAGADTLAGLGGADVLRGGAGGDTLLGGDGNDLLWGGAGSDVLDGGAGIDTAAYSGVMASYGFVSQDRVSGGAEGGTDFLTSVEVLRFLDGRLSFDTTDATTVVYRLYDAAFDRAPDVFGLADYSRALENGQLTVHQILDIFQGSAEFQARYGGLSNEQYVREMYRFSLNREGDAAGVASYVSALNAGTLTRAQVLGIFSESQEHQALINAVILRDGLFVQDEATAAVARLYDTVFNRVPDLAGLQHYRDGLDQGVTLKTIANVFMGSPEFQERFGSLSNQQFVEQLYRFVLDREGDAAGIQAYVQALNTGLGRDDLVLILSESPEHRFSYQATYDAEVRRLGVEGYNPAAAPDADADAFLDIKAAAPHTLPGVDDERIVLDLDDGAGAVLGDGGGPDTHFWVDLSPHDTAADPMRDADWAWA